MAAGGAAALATAAAATGQGARATAEPSAQGASTPTAGARAGAGVVALTFDAGADRGYTEDILDVLADQHVLGSFGITGQWAKANPDLVRRMAADGHMVFNHTLTHQSFTGLSDRLGGLSPPRRRAELEDADAIIAPLIGHSTRPWYRLPYGDDDAQVAADVAPAGYERKIGWTVDSLGWRGASVEDIISRCLRLAAPRAIYVFHVGRASRDGAALPTVIDGLKERGFSFARVDEL
jgi:peptidoglycan/xylan/chitin deacetylase (PgdA/CDA1 family)